MPAPTAPSRRRKNPASASRRRWNGRSGSPSGSTILAGGSQTARAPSAASTRPTSAPEGKRTRRASAALPAGINPARPIASHASAAASEPASMGCELYYHRPHMKIESRTARLTILVDPRKKAVFERLCAEEDQTPSQVVRRLIREYIEKRLGRPWTPGKS